jgi:hypothetical protein
MTTRKATTTATATATTTADPYGMTNTRTSNNRRTSNDNDDNDSCRAEAREFDLFCRNDTERFANDRSYFGAEEFDCVEEFVVVQGGYAHLEADSGDAAQGFVHLEEF